MTIRRDGISPSTGKSRITFEYHASDVTLKNGLNTITTTIFIRPSKRSHLWTGQYLDAFFDPAQTHYWDHYLKTQTIPDIQLSVK